MPETTERNTSYGQRRNSSQLSTRTLVNRRATGPRQATDFTSVQNLKLKAGDMRMARMQVSLTKLRLEMEQSNKLIEQMCQEAQLDLKSYSKPKQ
ncbi:uncharacterized protein LOC108605304 [Drosophila busckii]|uniref:uncharacterized protein LOC108605304 n=1 Tax=Drosophila busckii TaxID=30019 RepID=UPI00083F1ABF|nr:uncharacterized protein LOC108605304 [Drosophila busckii]